MMGAAFPSTPEREVACHAMLAADPSNLNFYTYRTKTAALAG